MKAADRAWNRVLASVGLPPGELLGVGIEGSVFNLHNGTVAKVWNHRDIPELDRLGAFYDAVAQTGPTIEMPRILHVLPAEDVVVAVEVRLPGEPVWLANGSSPDLTTSKTDAMIQALAALADIPGLPVFRSLPILPGEPPLAADQTFEIALAGLVENRVDRFTIPLQAALPSVVQIAELTSRLLRELPTAAPRLVHGDLIPANVLRRGNRASAVLDFGFLTTTGDPAFDAAIAASCFDMYGPRARQTERQLDQAFAETFNHDPQRLAVYRAAYALITACCFGDNLNEGHFAWCIAMLERPDIKDILS
jgi:aminoglycoside phosphotransferase (APT) family kinase protein